jgi:hypothetical protein
MQTLRTFASLRKCDAHRLMTRGYEIDYIETSHSDAGDEPTIIWSRPPRPDDIPEHELPF